MKRRWRVDLQLVEVGAEYDPRVAHQQTRSDTLTETD
jgi:hypothetical protein